MAEQRLVPRTIIPTLVLKSTKLVQPQQLSIEYVKDEEEDDEELFPCSRCSKAFSNTVALRNHRRTQHGLEQEDPDVVVPSTSRPRVQPRMVEVLRRERVPTLDLMSSVRPQSLVTLASEDVSYIIIKTEDSSSEPEVTRRIRPPSKRPYSPSRKRPTKDPVQLTGPFECLQPSTFLPHGTCHQIFFSCCEYSLHFREEHTKRRKAALRCQVCEKQLDTDAEPGQPGNELSCQVTACGKKFTDVQELDEHHRNAHVKVKPYQCAICLKKFTQQGGVQQHMRMHTGDRPFKCTFCPKAFTQKTGLDQHLRTHTKIKPFRCVVCGKNFSQSVHLRQHMRTHTNIMPFECGVCGQRFKQSSHLNFHLKSHNIGDGEKKVYIVPNRQMFDNDAADDSMSQSNILEDPSEHSDAIEDDMQINVIVEQNNDNAGAYEVIEDDIQQMYHVDENEGHLVQRQTSSGEQITFYIKRENEDSGICDEQEIILQNGDTVLGI